MRKLYTLLLLLMASTALSLAQTWTVAGTAAALNGTADWAPANEANDMTSSDGTNYTLVVTGCTLETGTTYQYKVVMNHAWSEAYPSSNKTFTVSETAVYTVTYHFNSDTKAVSEECTKTGEAGAITHTYSVAGEPAAAFGTEWDETNTATEMTLSDGLYRWSTDNVTLPQNTSVQCKVVQDHSWGTAYPSENATFTIPEDGVYTVTVTFNEGTKEVVLDCEKTSGATIESVYVVAGSSETLFGTKWDGTLEANQMAKESGIYKKTYTNVTLTEGLIEWKVVRNGSSWIPDGEGNNLSFYVPQGDTYDVVFSYDEVNVPTAQLLKDGQPVDVTPPTAEGWPANYGGVMLQGFFWDSFDDTKWTNLTAQADVLSKYFDLIWVPNSGNCVSANSMGYLPVYWFDHRSSFGNRERYLTEMIAAYKERGTKIIEDVVINHKSPVGKNGSWIDFANESVTGAVTGETYTVNWSGADICNNDDGGNTKAEGWDVTGAAETTQDFSGSRDLDHTSANVQQNCITYMKYLLKELGYSGFRLDMVKGYSPEYTKMYNEAVKPEFCVGEYWDSTDAIKWWISGTGWTSAAFDFPLKFKIKEAIGYNQWDQFVDKSITGDPSWNRYSVTFVDNHDTYEDGGRMRPNVLAANAFILAMPGTPCIFLKHWKLYPEMIGNMILARKACGITNQSEVTEQGNSGSGYVVKTQGTEGAVLCLLGSTDYDATGWKSIAEGTNFKFYVSNNITVEGLVSTNPEPVVEKPIPECAAPIEGHLYAYFRTSGNIKVPSVWVWNADEKKYTKDTEWPGDEMKHVGADADGNKVYLWDIGAINANDMPTKILFSNGGDYQTADLDFVNGGYYTVNGLQGTATGINAIKAVKQEENCKIFNLQGQRVDDSYRGIVIQNGKKFMMK